MYALVINGLVAQILTAKIKCHPDFKQIPCTDDVVTGWIYDYAGKSFLPPAPDETDE